MNRMRRPILMILVGGAAAFGLWSGFEARNAAPRLAAIDAVCRAVDEQRYDEAIAQSEGLAAADPDGRIAAECRCWALLSVGRRDECATTIDDVLQCYERVTDAGIEIKSTLGRHINDGMLSFYMASPFGFEVEIGWDGIDVGDDWSPRQFCEGDIWGHRGLDAETIQEESEKITS